MIMQVCFVFSLGSFILKALST